MRLARHVSWLLLRKLPTAFRDAAPPPHAVPIGASPPISAGAPLAVLYLNIGQGDATLIRSPGGRTMLIDGGNNPQDADAVIMPALQRWHSRSLNIMVITHPDQDHIAGLERVLELTPVAQVVLTGQVHTTRTYEQLLAMIRDKRIPAVRARAGKTLDFDSMLSTTILAPTDDLVDADDTNNASVVVRLTYGTVSFLFIGDAEGVEQDVILHGRANVRAQSPLIGHHGSRTATSRDWLQAVSPQAAIISVGTGNRYGHPHPETMQLLAKSGMTVYRTDQQGTVTVVSDGSACRITTER